MLPCAIHAQVTRKCETLVGRRVPSPRRGIDSALAVSAYTGALPLEIQRIVRDVDCESERPMRIRFSRSSQPSCARQTSSAAASRVRAYDFTIARLDSVCLL